MRHVSFPSRNIGTANMVRNPSSTLPSLLIPIPTFGRSVSESFGTITLTLFNPIALLLIHLLQHAVLPARRTPTVYNIRIPLKHVGSGVLYRWESLCLIMKISYLAGMLKR
jgi:hypothetical protein